MNANRAKLMYGLSIAGCASLTLLVRWSMWMLLQNSVLFAPGAAGGHDRSIYLQAIQRVADGQFWPEGSFEYLPLYPWLAGFVTMLVGNPLTAAGLLGVACDTVTTALIMVFALRLGAKPAWAAVAAMLYAFYPLASIYSLLTMPNTLNALGVTTFALVAHRIWLGPSPRRTLPVAVLGLLGGVFALGFAGMLMMAAVTAVALGFRFRSVVPPLVLMAGLLLPILPVAIHNTNAEGRLTMLTTHGGFNVYMGNHREATGYPLRVKQFRMTARDMLTDAHRYAEQQTGTTMSKSESSQWWSEQTRDFWRKHPLESIFLTGKKTMLFWNYRDVDDLRMLEQLRITDNTFRRWTGTPFAVFGFLGLIGLFYARGATIPRLILLAGMAGLVLFFITARYRLTLVPLMAVIGSVGITTWWELIKARPWPHALSALGVAILVAFPFAMRDQRPIDYYNAAIQLINTDRDEQAMDVVREGLVIAPNFAELHFALGNLFFKQQLFQEAAASYEHALALNPNQQTAWFNLALSLARGGDYCGSRDVILDVQRRQLPIDERMRALLRDVSEGCEAK